MLYVRENLPFRMNAAIFGFNMVMFVKYDLYIYIVYIQIYSLSIYTFFNIHTGNIHVMKTSITLESMAAMMREKTQGSIIWEGLHLTPPETNMAMEKIPPFEDIIPIEP